LIISELLHYTLIKIDQNNRVFPMVFNKKRVRFFALAILIAMQPIAGQANPASNPSFIASLYDSFKSAWNEGGDWKKYAGMLATVVGLYAAYRWATGKSAEPQEQTKKPDNVPAASQDPILHPNAGQGSTKLQPQPIPSVPPRVEIPRPIGQEVSKPKTPEQGSLPPVLQQSIQPVGQPQYPQEIVTGEAGAFILPVEAQSRVVSPEQQHVQVPQNNPLKPVTSEPVPKHSQGQIETSNQPIPQSRIKKPLTPVLQEPESIKSHVRKWIPKNYEKMRGAFLEEDKHVDKQYNFRAKDEINEIETRKIFEELVTELKVVWRNSNIGPEEVFDDIKNVISAFRFGGSIDSCRSKVFALLEEVVRKNWDPVLVTDIQPSQEDPKALSEEPQQVLQVQLELQPVAQIAPAFAPQISMPLQKNEPSIAEKKLEEEPIFIEKEKKHLDDWHMSDYLKASQNDKSSLFSAGEGSFSVIVKVISELNVDILNPDQKIYKESDLLSLLERAENKFHHYLLKPEKGYKSLTTKFTESDAQILISLDWIRPGAMIEYDPQSPSKLEKYYEDEFGLRRWNGNITKNKENFSQVHYWIAKAMHLKTFGFPAASAREACAYFNLWRKNTKAFANDPAFHRAGDIMCNKALLEK
jgi:hypothetical protein